MLNLGLRHRRGPGGRPIHLLEVGVSWPPERFLVRKFAALAARGVHVTVAPNAIVDPQFEIEGVEVLRAPGQHGAWSIWGAMLRLAVRSPRRALRLARNVVRAPAALKRRHGNRIGLLAMYVPLARVRPDVVQFEWNVAAVDHLPLFDVWSCPVLASCRGSDLTVFPHVPDLKSYAERLPEVLRRATAVHCVAASLAAEAARAGMDPAKARVIRAAVDPDVFRPLEPGQRGGRAFRILTIGEMRWEKGHEYGLQAIRALVDGGVPVELGLIAGAPDEDRAPTPEQQRVRHTLADLRLERHVRLLRRCDPREVVRLLQGSDVLLHPSLAEGIPNAVLEAMACGVPVVTTDCGGVNEAITHGVEGYVVTPRDSGQLASALRELWLDPARRRRMGEAGRRRVLADFTPQAQADGFLAMYQGVVG